MNRAAHARYIASDAWARRRARYFREHRRACRACGTTMAVELHHKFYGRAGKGREPDRDLVPLCRAHHQQVHDWERTGRYGKWGLPATLRKATDAVIRDVKRRRPPRGRIRAHTWRMIRLAVILVVIAVILVLLGVFVTAAKVLLWVGLGLAVVAAVMWAVGGRTRTPL